jgi:thermostable 8-oxoguanine DNA glycosylase
VTPPVVLSLEEAWATCSDLYERLARRSTRIHPGGLQHELLFCLLGGYGISYELNRSAADVVAGMKPFNHLHEEEQLSAELEATLSLASFEPRKADGGLRRYRYPKRKAALIVAARRWLLEQPPLGRFLMALPNDRERRAHMCRCPGIGPKTASWLLRNMRLATELAVLDVHVVRALSASGRLPPQARLPTNYDIIEDAFLAWCRELNADPGAFDLFVWEWQRGSFAT